MFYRTTAFSFVMTTASIINAACGCTQTPALKAALNQAQASMAAYISVTSIQEQQDLVNYLNYYRSEGGYHAVAPAPREVRERLSPASVELFKKLKSYAEPLILPATGVAGASRLSPQGNTYYETVIKTLKDALARRF